MNKNFFSRIFLICTFATLLFSCSNDDNAPQSDMKNITGQWIVTQKYLILSNGDTMQDVSADIIPDMNNLFDAWIGKGQILMDFSTPTNQVGVYEESIYSKNADGNNVIVKANFGSYVMASNDSLQIILNNTETAGGVWNFMTGADVYTSSLMLKQSLNEKDLEFLWKVYGGGNREFFSTDRATLITRAVKKN